MATVMLLRRRVRELVLGAALLVVNLSPSTLLLLRAPRRLVSDLQQAQRVVATGPDCNVHEQPCHQHVSPQARAKLVKITPNNPTL